MSYIIYSPLHVMIPKKTKKPTKFFLNLNTYAGSRYNRTDAKKIYTALMWGQVSRLPFMEQCQLTFQLFKKTNGRTDRSNIISIHEKFFCDCLVIGDPYMVTYKGKTIKDRYDYKLEDDSDEYLLPTIQKDTEVDKENPRVEITVTPV